MYVNKYDRDSTGCISFFDEGKQYTYTNFKPYSAHRVFPCFDQPNLKARMRLTITTPSDWVAVSNEPAESVSVFNAVDFKHRVGSTNAKLN